MDRMTRDMNLRADVVLLDLGHDRAVEVGFLHGTRLFRRLAGVIACLTVPLLAGCTGPLSTLDPAGPNAAAVARLWWVMLAGAALIFALVMICLLLAYRRRKRARGSVGTWVVGLGLVFPTATLTLLLGYAVVTGERLLPHPGEEVLRLDGTARQWTWSFHYPDGGPAIPDGGPLVIPVGRPVDIHVTSEDVIHSFWIPRLGGKIDALPGHVNVIRLMASEPGRFGAQCAEFCGLGHTEMFFWVDAVPEDQFRQRTGARR